ncbi:MAG: antitoxin [Pararhizobium sp.]
MNAHDHGAERRTVRLFRNGRSQAVRIPKEWEFEGDEVVVSRSEVGTLTIAPARKRRTPAEFIAWLRQQPPLDDDFPEIDDFPPDPVDLGLPE